MRDDNQNDNQNDNHTSEPTDVEVDAVFAEIAQSLHGLGAMYQEPRTARIGQKLRTEARVYAEAIVAQQLQSLRDQVEELTADRDQLRAELDRQTQDEDA